VRGLLNFFPFHDRCLHAWASGETFPGGQRQHFANPCQIVDDQGCGAKKEVWNAIPTPNKKKTAPNISNKVSIRLQGFHTGSSYFTVVLPLRMLYTRHNLSFINLCCPRHFEEVEMKNLNLQVTLLVQKDVGPPLPRIPTTPLLMMQCKRSGQALPFLHDYTTKKTELRMGLILKVEPGQSPTFIFEARFSPTVKFTKGVKICATAGYQKNVVCGYSCK